VPAEIPSWHLDACPRIDVQANRRGQAFGLSSIALPDAASRRIRIPLR